MMKISHAWLFGVLMANCCWYSHSAKAIVHASQQNEDGATTAVADKSTTIHKPKMISVTFYGEAQCPYCRKFVTEAWQEVWQDTELRQYLDYTFVPWGNAYFATTACGSGPYDSQERACFYEKCITTTSDDEDACFGGKAIYQHSEKEGQMDIYESCMLKAAGLEAAVAFTYCVEGPKMDDSSLATARDLMESCVDDATLVDSLQECLEQRGKSIEIANAKKTPPHPGVPYVVVDGAALENPMEIKSVLCDKLATESDVHPKVCKNIGMTTNVQLRHSSQLDTSLDEEQHLC